MRKIFLRRSFVLLASVLFLASAFFISIPQAFATTNLKASAVISPNTANPGQTVSYTITITNNETSSANIGSVSLTLDPNFTIPDASSIIVTASHPWNSATIAGGVISSRATNGSTGKLQPSEFVQLQFSSTAPSVFGSYTWTAEAFKNIDLTKPFDPISPQLTITVSSPKIDQTIAFEALGGKTYGDTDFSISAVADSGLTVVFASQTPSVCIVSDLTVHIVSAGNCTIRASQVGDDNYNAAPDVDQSFAIALANQAITFEELASKVVTDLDFALSAISTSGLIVAFNTTTPDICSISGSTVHLISAGVCTIIASQAGDNNYNTASNVSNTFTVAPVPHSGSGGRIMPPSLPPQVVGQVLGVEKFIFTENMKSGSKGDKVLELQKFLNKAPYSSGLVVDGKFGPKTRSAVIKFQLASGLKGDGFVGPFTLTALNK